MKTKEELSALKAEVETLNKKLSELSEDELVQVTGSVGGDLQADFLIYINKAGIALTRANDALWSSGDTERWQVCDEALRKTRKVLQERLAGAPWSYVKLSLNKVLSTLSGFTGGDFDVARSALEACNDLLEGY